MAIKPIKFWSFGGYRMFCSYWWKDLFACGTWRLWYDVKTYWHRARYGWAPRDTWNLDHYLARVMAGSLRHLAETTHGAPGGYPHVNPADAPNYPDTDFAKWDADLRRWADVFEAYATDDYFEIHGRDYQAWQADEMRRLKAVQDALVEMAPWWGALWD